MLRRIFQATAFAITLIWSQLLFAESTTCSNGDLHRTIEIKYAEPGKSVPCEVLYRKSPEGTVDSVWRANHEAGFCENKAKQMINNLADMGWKCEDDGKVVDADAQI